MKTGRRVKGAKPWSVRDFFNPPDIAMSLRMCGSAVVKKVERIWFCARSRSLACFSVEESQTHGSSFSCFGALEIARRPHLIGTGTGAGCGG